MKNTILILSIFLLQNLNGKETMPWEGSADQKVLLEQVGKTLPELASFPYLRFPNCEYESILSHFPESEILLFGYGSLINKQSASRSLKPCAIDTMEPAIAFGVKRVFNYQAKKTDHWGKDQHKKEKAMANLTPSMDISQCVNGVIMKIDHEDLANLIQREKGYDLIPILIAPWKKVQAGAQNIEIKIAYTFMASTEPRDHVTYTSLHYYPIRGYLHAIQDGALEYGEDFLNFWNETTFLANGTTPLTEWDQNTFEDILCTTESIHTHTNIFKSSL
jgi:cation transport regulator ChaC